jgi:hypothetical protein
MINVNKEHTDVLFVTLDIKEASLENSGPFKAEVIQLFDKYKTSIAIDMSKVE